MMKSKLLYGLFLSSMFISIDAKNKRISVSSLGQDASQVTITNPRTNDSTTITNGVTPTYSRSTTRPKIKAQAQANTTTTTTYLGDPVNQTFTEKTHTNPIGGSTTISNWNNVNQISHENPTGGGTYASQNNVKHVNKAGGLTNVYINEDTNYLTHTRSNRTGINNIVSTTIDSSDNVNGSTGGGHTNIAGGSTWVANANDGSGISGVHYTSKSVAIPIVGTTTTTTSAPTDTASNQS